MATASGRERGLSFSREFLKGQIPRQGREEEEKDEEEGRLLIFLFF